MTKQLSDLHDQEVRVTDASGGQKGKKLTQFGSLDPVALIQLARVAGMGANKYSAFNYLKGYDWSLSFNAMMRHANLFWAGEDCDPESGLPHAAHVAWMALSLVSFIERGLGTDDRPPRLSAANDETIEVGPLTEAQLREFMVPLRTAVDQRGWMAGAGSGPNTHEFQPSDAVVTDRGPQGTAPLEQPFVPATDPNLLDTNSNYAYERAVIQPAVEPMTRQEERIPAQTFVPMDWALDSTLAEAALKRFDEALINRRKGSLDVAIKQLDYLEANIANLRSWLASDRARKEYVL